MKTQMQLLQLAAAIFFALSGCSQQPAADEAVSPDETQIDGGTGSNYSVDITAADFGERVDNPYYPLKPGTKWTYEAKLEDGEIERIELEILQETREVKGIKATVLHDMVFVNDELVEDTYDWFAQDKEGNVWYLGEEVDNYEDGVVVDHDGSWEWGVDGALPGIIMWADPAAHLDEDYYQEYYLGEAEDMGRVLAVGETVTVPAGTFDSVVKTFDFSSLDPELKAHKYYAPGVGVIKEVELDVAEEVLLLEYLPAGD